MLPQLFLTCMLEVDVRYPMEVHIIRLIDSICSISDLLIGVVLMLALARSSTP